MRKKILSDQCVETPLPMAQPHLVEAVHLERAERPSTFRICGWGPPNGVCGSH